MRYSPLARVLVIAAAALVAHPCLAQVATAPSELPATISGRVVDDRQRPVPHMPVRLVAAEREAPPDQHDPPGPSHPRQPVARATTNADGQFTISDVPPGNYNLVTGNRIVGYVRETVTLLGGQTFTIDLHLPPRPPPTQR